jgi:hypothetical protein
VQLLGPERVGRAEHAIIDWVRSVVTSISPDLMQSQSQVDANRAAAALSEKGQKASKCWMIWEREVRFANNL